MPVTYTAAELEFIQNLLSQQVPLRKVSKQANDRFHNQRSIRTERSIEFATVKLGITKKRFTRICDICFEPFKTSWPQARYCDEECKAVVEREYAQRDYRRNPAANVQAQTLRVRQRIEARWKIILEHFGDRCAKCKKHYPRIVYDLHHPNGKQSREETPSKIIRAGTDEQFFKMLNATILMCANCHRLIHAEKGNWAPARNDA